MCDTWKEKKCCFGEHKKKVSNRIELNFVVWPKLCLAINIFHNQPGLHQNTAQFALHEDSLRI